MTRIPLNTQKGLKRIRRIDKVKSMETIGYNKLNKLFVYLCMGVNASACMYTQLLAESRIIDSNAADGEMVMTRLKTLIMSEQTVLGQDRL